jgi:hypothetical protein
MFNVFNGRIGRARFLGTTSICMLALLAAFYAVVLTANQTSRAPVNVPATIVVLVILVFAVTAPGILNGKPVA